MGKSLSNGIFIRGHLFWGVVFGVNCLIFLMIDDSLLSGTEGLEHGVVDTHR